MTVELESSEAAERQESDEDVLEIMLAVGSVPLLAALLLWKQFYAAALALPLILTIGLWLLARRRRASRQSASWPIVVLGNVLLLGWLLSLGLLAGETYYRFFHDESDSFSLTLLSQRFVQRHYPANNRGLCDTIDYPLTIDPSRRQILFAGDSFTVGYGLRDIENRFVNRIRRERDDVWQVQSVAQIGADTANQLNDLRTFIEGTEPDTPLDTVVLVYCLNDISDIVPQWQDALTAMLEKYKFNPPFLCDQSLFLNLYYFRLVAARDPQVADYYGMLEDAYDGEIWEQQEERLREFRNWVHERDGQLLVVIFPFLQNLGPDYVFQEAHERLQALFAQMDTPCLDLLELMQSHRDEGLRVNRHDAHPNIRAHALAAEAILPFIEANLAPAEARAPASE